MQIIFKKIITLILSAIILLYPFATYASSSYKTPHFVTFNAVTVSSGDFLPLAHTMVDSSGSTEDRVQTYMFVAGTWSGLSVYVRTANGSGDSTFTVRKNGVDTGLTVTVPQSTTGLFQDLTNSVSVSVGDLISIGVTTTAGTIAPTSITTLFESNSGTTTQYLMANAQTGITFSNSDRFIRPVAGDLTNSVTNETNAGNRVQHGGNIIGLATFLTANTRTANSIVDSRVANSSGLSITIPSSTAGMFTDTGTQSFAQDDIINSRFSFSGGTGTATIANVQLCIQSTNARELTFMGGFQATRNNGTGNSWSYVGGYNFWSGASESVARIYPVTPGVLSRMAYYASANTATASLEIDSRKSGADGNLQIIYTGTGWLSDNTNSDTMSSTNYFNIKGFRTAAGTGSTTFQHNSFLYTMDAIDVFTPIINIF